MSLKKTFTVLTFLLYLVFSQFVIKALATTDIIADSQEDFCMTEMLDTYESKRSCRKKHNIANVDGITNFYSYLNFQSTYIPPRTYELYVVTTPQIELPFYAHAPPWLRGNNTFTEQYVGITLLLL